MKKTIKELKEECRTRNIRFDKSTKYSRSDLIKKLSKFHLEQIVNPSWGLLKRLEIDSPMLCFAYKHLEEHEKYTCLHSPDWIAEKKWNGDRMLIFYHPDEGFTFFSRNISVKNYLPVPYTDKILLIKDGKVSTPESFNNTFPEPFILDAEVITDSREVDTTVVRRYGVKTNSELNAVSTLLALNAEDSKKLQREQASLKFIVFDILYYNEDWKVNQPLRERKKIEGTIVERIREVCPFYQSEYVCENKEQFYKDYVEQGGEGVVLKNLNEKYNTTTSRKRNIQVKLKKSMTEALGTDIDTFITGFGESKKGRAWENHIGALKVSIFIKDKDGKEVEHFIGSVAGIPLELREKMTSKDSSGKPTLNPKYLGQVITVDGQSISARNHRFSHCRVENWDIAFRPDKTKHDCIMDRQFLLDNVM